MNNPLISKVASYLRGMCADISGMAELAPGVIGVHDTYGKSGKWDAYFDMTRWKVDVSHPCIEPEDIGVLEGAASACRIIDFHQLRNFAQSVLQPVDEGLGWYAEPKEISPAEYGGVAMFEQLSDQERAALADLSSSLLPGFDVFPELAGLPQSAAYAAVQAEKVQRFWEVAERLVQAGTYSDDTIPINSESSIRAIELITGKGLVRCSVFMKVYVYDDGILKPNVDLLKLTYANEGDEHPNINETEYVHYAPAIDVLGRTPYSELEEGMNREKFESASAIDAFRALTKFLIEFGGVAGRFLEFDEGFRENDT